MAINTGVIGGYNYAHILTTGTTVVKTGNGVLHTIVLNNPVATCVIAIYDGLSGAGIPVGLITVPASPQPVTLEYDINFTVGLTIITATAASDITVSYV